ncbi:MAG: hypothetical protein AB7V32_00325 [Candidatus Berkiella sp.]
MGISIMQRIYTMRYTDTFKTVAKKRNIHDIQRLLFEMPPVPTSSWMPYISQSTFLPADNEGLYSDISANVDFIVELMKGDPANYEEVIRTLITSMTTLQSNSNINIFLGLLNSKLNNDTAMPGMDTMPYTISSWAVEHAPYMLDMAVFQQDLYETHVRDMVKQAIRNNDPEALQILLTRHAETLPDQLQPSMLESMKEYIPMWVRSMMGPELSYLLGERVKFEIFSLIDDPSTSAECQSILAPYSIEQKARAVSYTLATTPAAPGTPTPSSDIATQIYKYKLTDNPRAMRALKVAQLVEAASKVDQKAFKEKLSEVKDLLDVSYLYVVLNTLIPTSVAIDPSKERTILYLTEELLESTQPLFQDNPNGLGGMWENFMRLGFVDLLKIPGVMPDEIQFRQLKDLIKINAEKANIEILDLLIPYAKQQRVSILFGDNELNLNGLSKDDTAEVLSRLDDMTSSTKRPPSLTATYRSQSKAANARHEPNEAKPATRKTPKMD